MLWQVTFFAVIGRLLSSPAATQYLLIGNAVVIAVMESTLVVASTTWERRAGTLPLMIAAPTSPVVVFSGRSIQWMISGSACASLALFTLAPIFGVPVAMPRALLAIPLIATVSISAYCFGLFLAGIVLRAMHLRNVVGNLAWWCVALLAGVQVPTSFWPGWLQAVAFVLPARHSLTAIRNLLNGGPVSTIWTQTAYELLVAAGWLAVAALTFRRLAEHGRRDGSIEFGD